MAGQQNRLMSFLSEDVAAPSHIDLILLVMTFSSALVDTMTVPVLKTFIANSTGNLLLLGLGAAGAHRQYPDLVIPDRSGVALVSSWCAAFLTGHLMRRFGVRCRVWLVTQFAFESLLVFVPAILAYTRAVELDGPTTLILIWLLAWSYGSQGVVTKTLGVPTITVQVVTGAMGDLFSDAKLFALDNKPRNQRAAFILTFFVGSVVGGLLVIHVNGELVLLLTAITKLLSALMFLLLPAKPLPKPKPIPVDAPPAEVAAIEKARGV